MASNLHTLAKHSRSHSQRIVFATPFSDIRRSLSRYVRNGNVNEREYESMHEFVDITTSPDILSERLHLTSPDIAVLYYKIADEATTALLQRLRAASPKTAFLMLGNYISPSLIERIFQCGASGYLLAMPLRQDLETACDALLAGNLVLDKQLENLVLTLRLNGTIQLV